MQMTKYMNAQGRIYEARKGLGESFMTMCAGHRVKSIYLPVRGTLAEAQADLDAWAEGHGLSPMNDGWEGITDHHGIRAKSNLHRRHAECRSCFYRNEPVDPTNGMPCAHCIVAAGFGPSGYRREASGA